MNATLTPEAETTTAVIETVRPASPIGKQTPVKAIPVVRPWMRFWARQFDIFCATVLFGFSIGFVGIFAPKLLATLAEQPDLLWGLAALLTWVFIESLLLTTVGTTPGKWLFNIQVSKSDSSPITYLSALNRSSLVWFRGLGLGLPIISLFTMLRAEKRLTTRGITSWDDEAQFVVRHGKLGVIRATAAIVVTIICFATLAQL